MFLPSRAKKELSPRSGFCYPDWKVVEDAIRTEVPDSESPAVWREISHAWLMTIANQLGRGYKVLDSPNFHILVKTSCQLGEILPARCESFRGKILSMLEGIAEDAGRGKNVVMVYPDNDVLCRYMSYFDGDGEHPEMTGVCVHSGYTHVALCPPQRRAWEAPGTLNFAPGNHDHAQSIMFNSVLVHELIHNFLSHLSLPLWLNEALTMRVEGLIWGGDRLRLDRELHRRHMEHWSAETIQDFWSGASWGDPGEGFELSYSLAQVLWEKIEHDLGATKEEVCRFVRAASANDAGETALKEVFAHGLEDLVSDFLGEGDWSPRPLSS